MQSTVEANKYNDEDLVEIRVPLNLPYQTDWKEFQAYDGEIKVDGVDYRYVKRKVEHGQLVLLCIPNHSKTHLGTARDQFFMLVNDLQHNGHSKSDGKTLHIIKNPVTEYVYEGLFINIISPSVHNSNIKIEAAKNCLPGYLDALIQPPDFSI